MDLITSKIAALTLTQVTEAKKYNNVDKTNVIEGHKFLRRNGVTVDQITTERHSQIRKQLRENEKDTIHKDTERYYILPFCKSISYL